MIIKQDDANVPTSKAVEATLVANRDTETNSPEELPPPYSTSPTVSGTPSVRPTNFLNIHELNKKIKGIYVIDPKMIIPPSLLPANRRNLSLTTTNGSIDADVTMLPAEQRVTILMKSTNGQVRIKLSRSSGTSPAFYLEGSTTNGTIHVFLPRSFEGPVTTTTQNGRAVVSDAVAPFQTQFSHLGRMNIFFIGDTRAYIESDTKGLRWTGDEVVVQTTNGGVKLFYEDEAGYSENSTGFLGRIWNSIF